MNRLWLAWCVFYLGAVTLALGIGTSYPGDEARFIETAKLFGRGISLDLLKHYPEMSGPLPFFLYGLWGESFGYSLAALRCWSLMVALAALVTLLVFLKLVLKDSTAAVLSGCAICLNPYMATMSLFVYTDMTAVLLTLSALVAGLRGWPVATGAALAAALLSRQYMIFLAVGMGAFFLTRWTWRRDDESLWLTAACALSVTPLAALMVLWGGLAPDSWMRGQYVTGAPQYQMPWLTGYLAQMPFYLALFMIAAWRRLAVPMRLGGALLALSGVYWLFPIRIPAASLEIGLNTVGLLDRGVSGLASGVWRDGFYWMGFAASLLLLTATAKDAWLCWRSRQPDYPLLTACVLAAFLLVMPWSYLYWEKYLLPLLPVTAAYLALTATGSSKI